jgi:hypothetical protein
MPATIGVNSHLQWFFKILSVRRAAKVCANYYVPFKGPACSLFWIAADARRRIQLALDAKVGGQQWPGTMLWRSRHCALPFYFQTTHRLVTTGSLRTRRSSNGSISSRAEKGCAARLPDGVSVKDVDWDAQDGHYRVRLHGEWVDVPEDALVTEPNRFGPAVVWPYEESGKTRIRCFMPGAGT